MIKKMTELLLSSGLFMVIQHFQAINKYLWIVNTKGSDVTILIGIATVQN